MTEEQKEKLKDILTKLTEIRDEFQVEYDKIPEEDLDDDKAMTLADELDRVDGAVTSLNQLEL